MTNTVSVFLPDNPLATRESMPAGDASPIEGKAGDTNMVKTAVLVNEDRIISLQY
jgi:hypothetical protein